MSNKDAVRAWQDEEYRLSLSRTELEQLAPHPAGIIELTDAQMSAIGGGSKKKKGTVIINNVIPIVIAGEYPGGVIIPITITNVT